MPLTENGTKRNTSHPGNPEKRGGASEDQAGIRLATPPPEARLQQSSNPQPPDCKIRRTPNCSSLKSTMEALGLRFKKNHNAKESKIETKGPQAYEEDGMGNLRVTKKGIRLEGVSEFLLPLYVKEIHSRKDSPLVLQSDRNVTVNARNHMGQLTGQLTVGADAVEAQCKRFEVRANEGGKLLFSADEDEIIIGADRLKVTGTEGAVFGHSVETPHIRAEPSQDLKLESPTRSLIMEAPKGVQVSAAAGDLKATCRKELHLQSTEGEIFLNADTIRLGNLPMGSFSSSSPSSSAPRQTIYEVCVCPSGKLYLSPAGSGSTCQSSSNICLWS
ncbi:zeta-sarcoglycan [Alligator sinensis]|uniref:Zeta-sarcoglycan n=1 Tax=Alligator sinensis TaxID=38654 RepID=A0A1U8CY17_ALLSI|nr:zeta-sarcoglycan [Alligator sinensis]